MEDTMTMLLWVAMLISFLSWGKDYHKTSTQSFVFTISNLQRYDEQSQMWGSKECIARANAPLRKTFHGVCNNVAILISFQERSRDLLWLLFEGEAVSTSRCSASQDGSWGSMVWIQVPSSCTFCIDLVQKINM